MKKLALVMITCMAGVVLSAEEYTIQTISALKESSITPAFEKNVEKTALPSARKKEGVCNIVTVGRYASAKEAKKDLKKAKTVAKDAFVRTEHRTTPEKCAGGSPAVQAVHSGAVHPAVAEQAAAGNTKGATETQPQHVAAADAHAAPSAAAVAATPAAAIESVSVSSSQETIYIYDRNLARKSDIHEAIEYYKNSPYHTFRPVAMQGGKGG